LYLLPESKRRWGPNVPQMTARFNEVFLDRGQVNLNIASG